MKYHTLKMEKYGQGKQLHKGSLFIQGLYKRPELSTQAWNEIHPDIIQF
jgi:hypothetical protein